MAGDDGFRGGVDDLFVEGDAGLEVHVERDYVCSMTARTVGVKKGETGARRKRKPRLRSRRGG